MVTARVLVFMVVATFLGAVGIGGGALSPVDEALGGRAVIVKVASSSLVGGGQAADGRWRKPCEGR